MIYSHSQIPYCVFTACSVLSHIWTEITAVLHSKVQIAVTLIWEVVTVGTVHSLSTFCEQPDRRVDEQHLGQFSYVENCRMSPTAKLPESIFLTSFFIVSFLFCGFLLYVYLHACVLSSSFPFFY
jgi:hypothetical protein